MMCLYALNHLFCQSSGGVDVQALAGSQRLGMQIRLIRKVKGANPFQAKRPLQMQYVYLYCGLYEVDHNSACSAYTKRAN